LEATIEGNEPFNGVRICDEQEYYKVKPLKDHVESVLPAVFLGGELTPGLCIYFVSLHAYNTKHEQLSEYMQVTIRTRVLKVALNRY
jgi:hypothetical protein